MDRRVKFLGLNDLATYWDSRKAIEALDAYDSTATKNINDIIELYNSLQFIKNQVYPNDTTEADKSKYAAMQGRLNREIAAFFAAITDATIDDMIKDLNFEYHDDYLTLFEKYNLCERITGKSFLDSATTAHIPLASILKHKKIVLTYDSILRATIIADTGNAELLLDASLVREKQPINLPSSLTAADSNTLIKAYIASKDANPNYLELITKARISDKRGIDTKIKLQAKQAHDAWTDKFFKEHQGGMEFGYKVWIDPDQHEEMEAEYEEGLTQVSFSEAYLNRHTDYPTILNNFIHLFGLVDDHFIAYLPSFTSELGLLEVHLGVRGREEYPAGFVFQHKDRLTLLETQMYYEFLKRKDIDLEAVIGWFFSDYLKDEFGAEGFEFNHSTETASFLEKTRNLFAEMDGITKQFTMYVNDGAIDPELLFMGSGSVPFSDIPSLLSNNYYYSSEDGDIATIMRLLFSSQSGLVYINDTLKDEEFVALVVRHSIKYTDLHKYQHSSVDFLLEKGVLEKAVDGILSFKSHAQIMVLRGLYEKEAISYYHVTDEERSAIDDMVAMGWLTAQSTLLTVAESDYFDYYLNQSKFSNGPEIRNKYLHASQARGKNDTEHYKNYLIGLRLMLLLVIKINDEFCVKHQEEK